MKRNLYAPVEEARQAALDVLLNNANGPFRSLPRAAAWGYPEPYTRDLMISALGILASGNELLLKKLRRVLETLARNQSLRGNIPSLAHEPQNLGASDTTPLFLIALAVYRRFVDEPDFLEEAAQKALTWMDYQSPDDFIMVAQQPTTDWRDEQWVLGYGLYVNALVYGYLRLFDQDEKADLLRELMNRLDIHGGMGQGHVHQGLVVPHKPYYALWAFKVHASERFDLLGNSLAVLFGIASPSRSADLISWVEAESRALREKGDLAVDLPPNLFPYMQRDDPDWRIRYELFGRPGEYHNGGIWPFICGFYVAAAVAAGRHRIAERNLDALTHAVLPARAHDVAFGFNEWLYAYDGTPRGEDWQTWSAAMYLYAVACVETGKTPFFEAIRRRRWERDEPPDDQHED